MPQLDRRRFVLFAAALPAVTMVPSFLAGSPPCVSGPKGAVAPPGEPGEPLVVSGQVLQADGVTPAAGVTLYVYQTDVTGIYARSGFTPRLRAFLKTDARGRYEYRTIKPAPYPASLNPGHIHTQLWGQGVPPQYGTTMVFENDPLVGGAERTRAAEAGRFSWVRPLARDGDTLRTIHDLRLKTTADIFEESTDHGLKACGLA